MIFPKFSQWKQIFKVVKGVERTILLIFISLAVISGGYLATDFYISNTNIAPTYGSIYTEGVVGQPRFINPIYGETNDIDRTLIGLVYAGLMTYDNQGNIVNDLVKEYQISEDGKTYSFTLKDDLFWQDGVPLTVEDVVYTIKTIQNSDYKSPLRANWLNVEIEKTSDKSFAFHLGTPYNSFLENCTIKIIPAHIWEKIPPENFTLSSYNLQPIGAGPYIVSLVNQSGTGFIKNISLSANKKYHQKTTYITNLSFQFFADKDELVRAANQRTIDGFAITPFDNNEALVEKEVRQGWSENEQFNIYSFSLPRYFAVFFNPSNLKILSDPNITQALNYSVDKSDLVEKISNEFKEKISIVNSPILPDYFGYAEPTVTYAFNQETANKLLDKSGFVKGSDGLRSKPNAKKPAFQFKSYLSATSKGTEVIELQGCLARLDNEFKNLLANETNGTYGKGTENAVTAFQKKYLPEVPSTGEVGTGTRKKLNELCFVVQDTATPLTIKLTTINQSQIVRVANLLRDYWKAVGVTVEINAVELSELKDVIKNRDYDMLLYGQAIGLNPDIYPFWHSTQINDPGLNFASYQNKNVDKLLKDSRETTSEDVKIAGYEKLQDTILKDSPAVFLYNPDYVYWISKKVKGIDTTKIVDPAKRFENITNWYINTKRVFK